MNDFYMIENHPEDSRVRIDESGTCQTLSARCGTGGGQRSIDNVCRKPLRAIRGMAAHITGKRRKYRGCSEGLIISSIFPETTGALCANSHPGSYTGQDAFNNMLPVIRRENGCITGQNKPTPNLSMGAASTLMARDYKSYTDLIQEDKMENTERKYVLRRLTPLECLRLMGLPDWWVDGTDGSDSAIYKMCGNGLAIPCAYDVIHRIANELEKSE